MNDIPAFSGCGGLSTLILREIPYKKAAFVMVRAFERETLDEHLHEAASLCRFAGAKSVFASAEGTELYPGREPDYKMLRLRMDMAVGEMTPDAALCFDALTDDNAEEYIRIYNACFADMLSAETLNGRKIRAILDNAHRRCGLYYIDGEAAAVSDVELAEGGGELNAIAVLPQFRGIGGAIMASIISDCAETGIKTLWINVMSTNEAALKLYNKCGAKFEKVLSYWYKTG